MFNLSLLEKKSIKTGEISEEVFHKTFEYLENIMPFVHHKARTGDPYEYCYSWLDHNYNNGNEFDE